MECVVSAQYNISHAGKVFGSIIPERGIRQIGPLSSYLFLICMEGFSALIRDYESKKLIKGLWVARDAPYLSHLFFVDDTYMFCGATADDADQIISMLRLFEQASGQKVNEEKSSVFFSRNTNYD